MRVISSLSIYQGISVVSLAANLANTKPCVLKIYSFPGAWNFKSGLIVCFSLRSVDISLEAHLVWEYHYHVISILKLFIYIRLTGRIVKKKQTKQIQRTKCKWYVMQHTVRRAGRCRGHGGCYPCVSCACYGTDIKVSEPSTVSSISKYKEYLAFSYSWTELQGQVNKNTSTSWKKNGKT